MSMRNITTTFDDVSPNEWFCYLGVEYQRANCGPYDKRRKAFCEPAEEWTTFGGRERVQVWRYL